MWIEILKQTSIAGSPVRVGQVIEASDSDAALLVAMKKAMPAPQDPIQAATSPDPEARPRPRKPRPFS